MSYTNPVLLKTLLISMVEMCTEGKLKGINFVGRDTGKGDENVPIRWSQEFGGKTNYLPTCVTEAEYVINLANLKGRSYGITLCGKNHFGSFINGNRMRPLEEASLHQWLTRGEMDTYFTKRTGFGKFLKR